MRQATIAGVCGLMGVALLSCGEEDPVNMTFPDTIMSGQTSIALRTTGISLLTSPAIRALNTVVNREASFLDFIMRGGLPEGELAANIAGTAPQQIRAILDNGSLFPAADSVDACGNPQLAAFISPDILQNLYPDATANQVMGSANWPASCDGDVTCPNTQEGVWQVGFSLDRADGTQDISLALFSSAGSPAYSGSLLAYLLSDNWPGFSTTSVFLAAKQITITALGMAGMKKFQISTSKPTLGFPQEVYTFPVTAREVDSADLIVAIEPLTSCEDHWKENYGGEVPFGCALGKPLSLDRTSTSGEAIYQEYSPDGIDTAKLDQLWDAWQYQLKTAMLCPDVSEPSWVQEGPVEIMTCPDHDIDLCLGFHDREDAACYLTGDAGTEFEAGEADEAFLLSPKGQGTAEDNGKFIFNQSYGVPKDNTNQKYLHTLTYSVGDVGPFNLVLEFPRVIGQDDEPQETASTLAAKLTTLEGNRSVGDPLVRFIGGTGDDEDKLLMMPTYDIGPLGALTIGNGNANDTIGFNNGDDSVATKPVLAASQEPYTTAETIHNQTDIEYLEIAVANDHAVIYTDTPDHILALFDGTGNEVALPAVAPNSHCEDAGPKKFELKGFAAGTYYIQLDSTVSTWLMFNDSPLYIH